MAGIQVSTYDIIEHIYRTGTNNLNGVDTYNRIFTDEQNDHLRSFEQTQTLKWKTTNERIKIAKENTGRAMQEKQKKFLHYSCVVECTKETSAIDVYESIGKWLENELGTIVYNVSIHRDEGHLIRKDNKDISLVSGRNCFLNPSDEKLYYDKNFTKIIDMSEYIVKKNYHAHIEFSGLRADGSSIAKQAFCDRKMLDEWKKRGKIGKAPEFEFQRIGTNNWGSYFQKMQRELLNKRLFYCGKELLKDTFTKEQEKINLHNLKPNEIKDFFFLRSEIERRRLGECDLSKEQERRFELLSKKCGYDIVESKKENDYLKGDIKSLENFIEELKDDWYFKEDKIHNELDKLLKNFEEYDDFANLYILDKFDLLKKHIDDLLCYAPTNKKRFIDRQ